jgi:hypothetical protein
VPTLLWADLSNPFAWIATGAMLGCGAVGLLVWAGFQAVAVAIARPEEQGT